MVDLEYDHGENELKSNPQPGNNNNNFRPPPPNQTGGFLPPQGFSSGGDDGSSTGERAFKQHRSE